MKKRPEARTEHTTLKCLLHVYCLSSRIPEAKHRLEDQFETFIITLAVLRENQYQFWSLMLVLSKSEKCYSSKVQEMVGYRAGVLFVGFKWVEV
uniref:RUN domain-containing protein n=1 Tax=Panagrellus redivivus TaxID=6233 RepID=A0A7E4USZ8_PANRE